MSLVNGNVVSIYLETGKPLRATVAVMDTIVIDAALKDTEGQPIDLTGCEVIIAATDAAKTLLYGASVRSATAGTIRTVVQPDVPGRLACEAKVSMIGAADQYTFFLGAFSVAAQDDNSSAPTIRSLTDDLLKAKEDCEAATQQAETLTQKVVYAGSVNNFPNVGDESVIYVAKDENASYRWVEGSSTYVCIGRDYKEIDTINGGEA